MPKKLAINDYPGRIPSNACESIIDTCVVIAMLIRIKHEIRNGLNFVYIRNMCTTGKAYCIVIRKIHSLRIDCYVVCNADDTTACN